MRELARMLHLMLKHAIINYYTIRSNACLKSTPATQLTGKVAVLSRNLARDKLPTEPNAIHNPYLEAWPGKAPNHRAGDRGTGATVNQIKAMTHYRCLCSRDSRCRVHLHILIGNINSGPSSSPSPVSLFPSLVGRAKRLESGWEGHRATDRGSLLAAAASYKSLSGNNRKCN